MSLFTAPHCRTVLAALLACTVLAGPAAAQTLPEATPPEAFSAPQVPADWQPRRVNGIELRLPADLVLMRDSRDEHVWGIGDENSREGFGLGIAFSDTPEHDMARQGAEPDGHALVLPGGQVFRRYVATVPSDLGVAGQMVALVSDLPLRGEDRLIVSVIVIGRDLDDYRQMFAQFLGAMMLPPPGGQVQRDFLKGVVRMSVGPGWEGAHDSDADQLHLFTDALDGGIWIERGAVDTGAMRAGTLGKAVLFMGEKARYFAYDDAAATTDDGTGDTGQARLIVLESCLPDGAAIAFRFAGMPALFHAPDVAAMVSGGAIVLPEGSAPCPTGVLPEASQGDGTDLRPVITPPFEVSPPRPVQPRASGMALGGLYTYRLPIGWAATPEPGEKAIRFANEDGSVTVTLVRGTALTGPDGPAALVPPGTYHRGTIAFGWPAIKYDWQIAEGAAGLNRLIIHDHCLPGDERFGMLITAPKAYLDGGELSAALREVKLDMPDDSTACPDPTEGVGTALPKRTPAQEAAPSVALAPAEQTSGRMTTPAFPDGSNDGAVPDAADTGSAILSDKTSGEGWFGQPPSAAFPSPATESLAGRWQGKVGFAQDVTGGGTAQEQPQTRPVEPAPTQRATPSSAPPSSPSPSSPSPSSPPPISPAPAADPDNFTKMEGGYALYQNGRYGTFIAYPASYFAVKPAPDSGDGRTFVSADGTSRFLVFAQYNALGLSQAAMMQDDIAMGGYDDVTYQKQGKGWYVLSGFVANDIFYRKVILDPSGLVQVFEISYPASLKQSFDPVVTYMAQSFGP